MKIQDIIEPARHLPFKIMITDPASKHAMEDVKNPYSGESCQLPRYAVAVYDVIKGAELLEDGKTMQKGPNLVSKIFYGPILHAVRLMKFLSVRKGATGSHSRPLNNKKKGGPSPKATSAQAGQLTSSQACETIL